MNRTVKFALIGAGVNVLYLSVREYWASGLPTVASGKPNVRMSFIDAIMTNLSLYPIAIGAGVGVAAALVTKK